jgi:hypothetical protein
MSLVILAFAFGNAIDLMDEYAWIEPILNPGNLQSPRTHEILEYSQLTGTGEPRVLGVI